eukprot:4266063-Karenia_brevis.AAC.1
MDLSLMRPFVLECLGIEQGSHETCGTQATTVFVMASGFVFPPLERPYRQLARLIADRKQTLEAMRHFD